MYVSKMEIELYHIHRPQVSTQKSIKLGLYYRYKTKKLITINKRNDNYNIVDYIILIINNRKILDQHQSKDPYLAVATPWSVKLDEMVSSSHHGLESCVCELHKPCEGIWDCSLPVILVSSEETRIVRHEKDYHLKSHSC